MRFIIAQVRAKFGAVTVAELRERVHQQDSLIIRKWQERTRRWDDWARASTQQVESRQSERDLAFCLLLGPESDTFRCRTVECGRGRVRNSVFCRAHHFEQIFKRPAPANA